MRQMAGGRAARGAAIVLATFALGFGLNACGDDDDEDSGDDSAAVEETTTTQPAADATNVTVTATEYDFELSATPTAETETITFDNQGKKHHVLVYGQIGEGYTLDEAIKLEGEKGSATTLAQGDAAPGKTVEVPVKGEVAGGDYVMLCPIQDKDGKHWELGQLEEFTIE